jgi:hypothetical protein
MDAASAGRPPDPPPLMAFGTCGAVRPSAIVRGMEWHSAEWHAWASGDVEDEAEVVALFGLVPLGIVALPLALATGYALAAVALAAMLVVEPELPTIPVRVTPVTALPGWAYAHA